MKNSRYLKKLGIYTDDTVCIGRRYMSSFPRGTPASFYVTYYQPSLNKIIMINSQGDCDIFSFNSDSMSDYFRFKKTDDLTFELRCYCFNDYISMFRKKMKFHGIEKARIRFLKATDDDFGNYKFKFKTLADAAVFQVYFSEFID
jgi:hypothetical protein